MTKLELPDISDIMREKATKAFAEKCCGSCDHSVRIPGSPDPSYIMCTRFPPVPLLYGMQEVLKGGRPQPVINAHFPQVGLKTKCGEWTPKTEGQA